MRKSTKKTRRLKYPILQTVQPELAKSVISRERLAKSIQKKQSTIIILEKKLQKLKHEVDMQFLLLATHTKNQKELQEKLNTINKKAHDISLRKHLIRNGLLNLEDKDVIEKIQEPFIESMKDTINSSLKVKKSNGQTNIQE